MEIFSGKEHIRPHPAGKPGSYEWWYFDFIDSNKEYSAVVIFLTGSPFSPDYSVPVGRSPGESEGPHPLDFCSISVNIYHKQRVVYRSLFEFGRENFSFSEDDKVLKISIANSSLTYDKSSGSWQIDVNYSYEKYGDRKRFELSFFPVADAYSVSRPAGNDSDSKHFWMPTAPFCNATLKIVNYANDRRTKSELSGLGYVDHNWGKEHMAAGIIRWYWGRVISNEHCLVFFDIGYKESHGKNFASVLLFDKSNTPHLYADFPFRIKSARNYWMLKYAESIGGKSDELEFNCKSDDFVDNGPFYVRSLCRFNAVFRGKKIFENAVGFSECIAPGRLTSPFLAPFVKLRIRRIS
ncbi:MAG: hypothetical protein K1X85_05345 [Ignavibacteria bacterium]|nr:hypothetical protein [Ignavibacteria bacterium]